MSEWEFDMSWWSVLARSHGGLCGRGNLPSYLFLGWPPQGFLAPIFGQGHRIYVWKEVENLYATIHQLTLTYHVRGTWGKEGLFWGGGGITRTELSPSSEHSQLRLCSHPFAWIFTRFLYWIVTGFSYTQIERMSICSSSHIRDRWLPSKRLSAFRGASASWNDDRRWERVELCLVYLAP